MDAITMRATREAVGLSQDQLAGMAGVTSRTVKRWERGDFAVPADVAGLLGELLAEQRRRVTEAFAADDPPTVLAYGRGPAHGRDNATNRAVAQALALRGVDVTWTAAE